MSEPSNGLYSRQDSLELLRYRHAVVVGLGGIGNWVALDLALSGRVEAIHLIDPDVIEESNLNRTIFRYCDIGTHKVDATKFQILERRSDLIIHTYHELTNPELLNKISKDIFVDRSVYDPNVLIFDCRDDIYDDLYDFNCKLYKVGYDGTSMTIDGNPRIQKVFTQRGGSYRVIPSYIGSSQLVAAIAVNDALGAGIVTNDNIAKVKEYDIYEMPFVRNNLMEGRDEYGRLNCLISFGCEEIIHKCSDSLVGSYDYNKVDEILKQEKEDENGN